MADGKKKSGGGKPPAKDAKDAKSKSALARGVESSKKQRAAAIQSKPKNAAPEKRKNGLLEYLKGVRTETKKVVWPTRKETVSYTIVVLIACAFFGLFLWGVDSGFLAIIREVFSISMG